MAQLKLGTLIISDSLFAYNRAARAGGAVYVGTFVQLATDATNFTLNTAAGV